jgi:hypothetical protein
MAIEVVYYLYRQLIYFDNLWIWPWFLFFFFNWINKFLKMFHIKAINLDKKLLFLLKLQRRCFTCI